MQKTILYIMGVSGCGKSTVGKLLAERLNLSFFDGDDYHPEKNVQKMAKGNPLNDQDREGWLQNLNKLAKQYAESGAIIACSALKESYRIVLKQGIDEQIVFIFLKGTFEEIRDRLRARKEHFMPIALLQSQFDILEVPKDAISISVQKKPEEIIEEILATIQN